MKGSSRPVARAATSRGGPRRKLDIKDSWLGLVYNLPDTVAPILERKVSRAKVGRWGKTTDNRAGPYVSTHPRQAVKAARSC